MLRRGFELQKISFVKKNIEHSHKMKQCKNIFKNNNCQEILRSKSFTLDLWY